MSIELQPNKTSLKQCKKIIKYLNDTFFFKFPVSMKLTENKEGFTLLLINVNNEILKTDKFKTLNDLQDHLFRGLETDNIITG